MSKKTLRILGTLLLAVIIVSTAKPAICRAAAAQISLSSDSEEIKVGDRFYVNINIEADTLIGNFEADLVYDESVIEYCGGASVISGSNGFLHISDMNALEGEYSRNYSMEFEALRVGKAKVEFYGRIMVYDYETDREMPVLSNVLELDVRPEESASKDARLKNLQIRPAGLNPNFDPDVFDYSLNVGNETRQLVITALPFEANSVVSISGNQLLNEGDNIVVVSVLSETGDIIEYKIKVYREPAAEQQAPDISDTPTGMEDYFDLIEDNGHIYAIFGGRYEIIEPDEGVSVPDGYKLGSLTISGITISAYVPENNAQSEYVLIYAQNEFGNKGFYRYDRIEKTLQRYFDNSLIINDQKPKNNGVQDDNSSMTKAVFVIVLLCALCILMTFIAVRMFIKMKGYKDDDLD